MARPRSPDRPGSGPATRPARPGDDPEGLVCLGAFSGVRGVRGEVRIKPFTADPLSVGAYGPVQDRNGRRYILRDLRAHKDGLIGRVEGITTRDAAEALKGVAFYVAREVLPETEDEDEFYITDLVGLSAVLPDGAVLGTVRAVHDFGAGDLLDVTLAENRRSVLVPFTREVVPEIDLTAGRVVVDPPEGLLDAPSGPPSGPEAGAEAEEDT